MLAFEENYEPMVAFKCDKPSMFLTSSGWIEDNTTGCLKDPSSILTFCQKVFPKLDIRNVVESTQEVMITKWCNLGEKECKHRFTVLPYRCLAGPFQSEALLVPEGCIFDHIHDSKFCSTLIEWSKSSAKNCQSRNMIQNSFSVLQPCQVDRFQGVEFVCCPFTYKTTTLPSPPSIIKNVSRVVATEETGPIFKENESHAIDHFLFTEIKGPLNDYLKVENCTRTKSWNEHESYKKAREDMEKIHHEKIAKMMKDWGIARQRVQELKSIDSKASEKLNREVTSRFQKTYEAEELEAEMEKKQLAELHEHRIQVILGEKKKIALDKYINAIEEEQTKPMEIYHALDHYLKILQKERLRILKKFKQVKANFNPDIIDEKAKVISYLDIIDKQVKNALDLLKQIPRHEAKVNAMIKKNIALIHSMDSLIYSNADSRQNISAQIPTASTTPPTTIKVQKYSNYDTFSYDDDDYDTGDKDNEYYVEGESKNKDIQDYVPGNKDNYHLVSAKQFKMANKRSDKVHADTLLRNITNSRHNSSNEMLFTKHENINTRDNGSDDGDEVESISIGDKDDIKENEVNNREDNVSSDDNNDRRKEATTFNTAPLMKTTLNAKTANDQNEQIHSYEKYKSSSGVQKSTKRQQNPILNKNIKLKNEDHVSGEPAHFNQNLLQVKQSHIEKLGKENTFSTAIPLGLTVGSVTVAIVIIAGVLVMRRRHNFRRHMMIPTEPMTTDLVTSPEENHLTSMQVNGYENPTYKYFEMNAHN